VKLTPDDGDKTKDKEKLAEARSADAQRLWKNAQAGIRAIASEMKRVTWPSRDEWVSATMLTVGLVVVVALWTSLMSYIASKIFGAQ
jgi:preprotein translocase SecE subunit